MFSSVPLPWLQLKHEPLRFAVALGGIGFAVILVFMQLGFNTAFFESNVRVHSHLVADIVLISPRSPYLVAMRSFPRRRIYQALGFDGVQSVSALYVGISTWKNPRTGELKDVFVAGFDPDEDVFDLPGVRGNLDKVRFPDWFLFDRAARPEYGPVAAEIDEGQSVKREVANREITIVGLFELGTSFGIDGALISSDLNFLRLFPIRREGMIDVGLVRLKPGADVEAVRRALAAGLPNDVEVLTKRGFMEREKDYWKAMTPIGYVLGFGSIMGLVVGAVIVYQILFADISGHLAEYATLKAMGYSNARLVSVVVQQAFILAIFGYLPGFAVCVWLYRTAAAATHLPMVMTVQTCAAVLGLTILMCSVAAAIAVRKLRSADPAEIF